MASIEAVQSFRSPEIQMNILSLLNRSRKPSKTMLLASTFTTLSFRSSGIQIPHKLQKNNNSRNRRIQAFGMAEEGGSVESLPYVEPSTVLLRNSGLIGLATLLSKLLGLVRELVIAAVFGVGPVATAFNYALVWPSFFASFLGGVNGPIHITMTATLSKLSKENRSQLLHNAEAVIFLIVTVLAVLVYIFAEAIIYISAPGLWTPAAGQLTREIAITQLKLLTPCIIFAAPVGLGFGRLSAEGDNITPALSPALSSISIVIFCCMYLSINGSNPFSPRDALSGGVLIACGASLGAFLQWLLQIIVHKKKGIRSSPVLWQNPLRDKDIYKLFSLMLPATFSSVLAQISSSTDLYFASFIPGAAAGLSYARLLAMAPLGILSGSVVVPLLSTFSGLAKPSSWPDLKKNLQQAVMLCLVIILPVTVVMFVLAEPIVNVLFQRYAFDSSASAAVSSLLIFYSIGSPFYIVRELLVAVFYALEDGKQPLLIRVMAVLMNVSLDWIFTFWLGIGAQGLVLSTLLTTVVSTLALLYLLSKNLRGLFDFDLFIGPLLLLLVCCIISGFATFASHRRLQFILSSVSIFRSYRLSHILSISLAGVVGMLGFFLPLLWFKFLGLRLELRQK